MAHMARSYNTTALWQAGYYPEFDPELRANRLNKKISKSRQIGTLLMNWFWNTLIAIGIVLALVVFVLATIAITKYAGTYIQ